MAEAVADVQWRPRWGARARRDRSQWRGEVSGSLSGDLRAVFSTSNKGIATSNKGITTI